MSWNEEKIQGLQTVHTEHDACGVGAVVQISGEASHKIVDQALTIVERMEHRAGKDALQTTGDGVGVMLQIPHELFVREMKKQDVELGEKGTYGVGMCFFPMDETECEREKNLLASFIKNEDMELLGFREVPV